MSKTKDDYKGARNEVAKFLPNNYSKVLEIGCSEGLFIKNIENSCEYWGVEPNHSLANNAAQRLYKVLTGTYNEVHTNLPDNYFDLIICNDVIEHMTNPSEFLQMIKKKVVSGSYLIGSIPNIRHIGLLYRLLIQKDWMYQDWGILDKTHYKFFTEKSLKRLFIENGYEIELFYGINNRSLSEIHFFNDIIKNILIYSIISISFGYYKDIQFPQFGFRLKPL